jgi:Protein of unknown function (DUF1350)
MAPPFQPVSSSWVALHPKPKGVIQFIGGAFFGSLPTLFYQHLLDSLYAGGYTIVALPFRFSFRHWSIALSLLDEQQSLRQLLPELAHRQGFAAECYRDRSFYRWLGHSLGCKYIALLELLSDRAHYQALAAIIDVETAQWVEQQLAERSQSDICNQPALLLAADISDTATAIPIPALAHLLDRLKLGVQPTRPQTLALIERSRLFGLTGLISFERDTVAGRVHTGPAVHASPVKGPPLESDVAWLYQHLTPRGLLHRELAGKHLEPLGVKIGPWLVDLNPLDKFLKPLRQWAVGQTVLTLLKQLEARTAPIAATASTDAFSTQQATALQRMEATMNDVAS